MKKGSPSGLIVSAGKCFGEIGFFRQEDNLLVKFRH